MSLTTAQAHYDAQAPTEHCLANKCVELQDALYRHLQSRGFDVDGLEVEPSGQHVLSVICLPFPAINLVDKSVGELVAEWSSEISYHLI